MNGLDVFSSFLADNPLIFLVFVSLCVVVLLRWHFLGRRRLNHGPKLKREVDLYRKARRRRWRQTVPASTVDDAPEPQSEFNAEGKRIN